MAFDATVIVGTYGDPSWRHLARRRAIPSAEAQGAPVIHHHARTLAEARNRALAVVTTEWVIHLDADDELGDGYLEAMAGGTAEVRAPSRLDIDSRGQPAREPYVPRVWNHHHACTGECLRHGNWLLIGAAARTERAQAVGWEEFGWSEDWAFWARLHKAGASIETIPGAVYHAHRARRSRNRVRAEVAERWHREIERAVWPEEVAA